MTPIDIQVSRSKVKGHASLLHLVQLITQERFVPEASNLQGSHFEPATGDFPPATFSKIAGYFLKKN